MRRLTVLVAALTLVLAAAVAASAAQPGGYDLTWSTVDGGGATACIGGPYELGGTAGQPDAGDHSGGSYSLAGGFWGLAASFPGLYRSYLPVAIKDWAGGW